MSHHIPSPQDVRAELERIGYSGVVDLSRKTGCAESSLLKIMYGYTKDPGIGFVGRFWPALHRMIERAEKISAGSSAVRRPVDRIRRRAK